MCAKLQIIFEKYSKFGGMWWCRWLRHCITNEKDMGSIPDGHIGIFHRHNPFGHTMGLGSSQLLTEMCTRNISGGGGGGKGNQCMGLTTFVC
jgi:hypothetical protein